MVCGVPRQTSLGGKCIVGSGSVPLPPPASSGLELIGKPPGGLQMRIAKHFDREKPRYCHLQTDIADRM